MICYCHKWRGKKLICIFLSECYAVRDFNDAEPLTHQLLNPLYNNEEMTKQGY